jgi:hypothetical protein
MNIGMLWFDNDVKTDLPSKIRRAATYYKEKYGQTPYLCFVHPSMLKVPLSRGRYRAAHYPLCPAQPFLAGRQPQR